MLTKAFDRRVGRLKLVAFALILLIGQAGEAQQKQATCKALPTADKTCSATAVDGSCLAYLPTCSFTGLNGSCQVYIDRMRPIVPPTIYTRRGSTITVHVINPSAFEKLSLDYKSAADSVPPDLFSAGFSSLSGSINKLEFDAFVPNIAPAQSDDEKLFAEMRTKLKTYAEQQRVLLSEIDVAAVFRKIAAVLQAPPTDACDDLRVWDTDGYPNPWLAMKSWGAAVDTALLNLETPANLNRANLKTQVDQLVANLAPVLAFQPATSIAQDDQTKWKNAVNAVKERETKLQNALSLPTITPPATANLEAMRAAIQSLGLDTFTMVDQVKTVTDLAPHNPNYTTVTWNLDFSNNLTTLAKNALGSAPSFTVVTPSATDIVTAAAPSSSVATVSVSFQRQPRLEFATGLMVPVKPYHSYSAAETASAGGVTGTVVQQTLTYTVVPMALVNVVVAQGLVKRKPVAGFFTVSTGYNPATSSVEFGVGPTFSWRSFMISGLADIGRDTELAGGFKVGQSLPSNTKPLTNTYWSVKPAIGISVRIPLGGSGGGGGSSGGTGSTSH